MYIEKVLVICGGDMPSQELLEAEIISSQYVIAADKGGEVLYKYKRCPDLLVGDFDSIDNKTIDYFKQRNTPIEKYPMEKDFTDGEMAVEKAIAMNPQEIVLLGCNGARLDHVFSSIGLLYKVLKSNIRAYIKNDNNTIFLSDRSTCINPKKEYADRKLSVLPYGAEVTNLTIKGAKYPLNNFQLRIGDMLTVSNEFIGCQVDITFDSGILIIFLSKD
ncbi:thiamine diphosphokinase [Clostridium cellulovorans]|uniref:Thiamine diphosphokinase n=1 Tax=Clostridium cellulovorans (strain ATCC 35296 / DSM 3052 / OCM 3 / 743B) TaxID=573061 RepID=D9SLA9_CLOC7|nr:thiamine diphosphokinase [Clostridium cellulovorans]ADL51625.1 thiamine pyrophosphokinase [Clostridium cellulovorans 743B]